MGDSKALPLVGGVMLVFFLPLLLVVAMLVGVLSGWSSASECTPAPADSSMAWPTDKHAPDQGWDDEGNETHKGMDFVVDKGSKVYAVESGTVKSADGDWIKIKHGDGLESWYQYFATKAVGAGDKVERGQVIGTSGEGTETAPGKSGAHLHFEVWAQEDTGGALKQTDPAKIFSAAGSGSGGGGCACGGTGGPLVGSTNQEKAFNFMVQAGYTKEQAAGVVGNMIHESQVTPTLLNGDLPPKVTHASVAVGLDKAWGIVQWYPAKKMINASREAGADDTTIESLAYQLEFLRRQLDGTGPVALKSIGDGLKATKTVEEAAFLFARDFEVFTLNDNDPEYDRRRATARQVFNTYGGGAAAPGKPGTGPSTACAAGSGNIAEVAKSLAWPDGGHEWRETDATPQYRQALIDYNSKEGYNVWSDCGRFVSTVMHMSGADPDYPEVGTDVMNRYLRTSGKYDVFDTIQMKDLQPGDIFIGPGHTYLFVGSFGKYNSASGSLETGKGNGHVPQAGNAYDVGIPGGFAVARLKKK